MGERGLGRSRYQAVGFLVAMAVVVVFVLMIAAVVFLRHSAGRQITRAPTTGPSVRVGTPAAGDCNLPDADQHIPQTGPPATWTVYKSIALPSSTTAGPAVVTGDVARCYAHTPTGALFAAVQIDIRFVVADDWRAVVNQQVVPGPGRDVYIKDYEAGNVDTNTSGGQFAGFKFVAYSPSQAIIQFASHFPDGSYSSNTVTVTWWGTDWRLDLQSDGQDSPTFTTISSLNGFIRWGGL